MRNCGKYPCKNCIAYGIIVAIVGWLLEWHVVYLESSLQNVDVQITFFIFSHFFSLVQCQNPTKLAYPILPVLCIIHILLLSSSLLLLPLLLLSSSWKSVSFEMKILALFPLHDNHLLFIWWRNHKLYQNACFFFKWIRKIWVHRSHFHDKFLKIHSTRLQWILKLLHSCQFSCHLRKGILFKCRYWECCHGNETVCGVFYTIVEHFWNWVIYGGCLGGWGCKSVSLVSQS